MEKFQVNLISFLVSIQDAPPSVAVTPTIQLQTEAKKHIMGDERMFERINMFIVTNKVPMTAVMFQNNPRNYVTSYETEMYQLQHICSYSNIFPFKYVNVNCAIHKFHY